ncbi:MAG: hypothetical protein WC277_11255 [Bacilli bacterium]
MTQYIYAGKLTRDRHALRVELDGRNGPGDLVIGATAVPELLSGRRVEINFVQCRTPDRVFIGFSGEAWLSRSGRAVTFRIEGQAYTSPIAQVRQVAAGTRASALFSRPVPAGVIDADKAQREAIDADLVRSFA